MVKNGQFDHLDHFSTVHDRSDRFSTVFDRFHPSLTIFYHFWPQARLSNVPDVRAASDSDFLLYNTLKMVLMHTWSASAAFDPF
jgi:hypothetical protein